MIPKVGKTLLCVFCLCVCVWVWGGRRVWERVEGFK